MSECIVMAVGVALGAACAIIAIGVVLVLKPSQSAVPTARPVGEPFGKVTAEDEESKKLKKQWENFLNYDGTEKDQMPIGEE